MVRWSVSTPNRGSPRAIRSASKAHSPQAGPAASAYLPSSVRGKTSYLPASSTGRQATAICSVRSSTSTRIMNRIRSSHSTSAAAWPGSVCAVKASPSSTPYITCSTCPCGDSTSATVGAPGCSDSKCCVVSECSQVSRSGPETRSTPRWERSTNPSPCDRVRCSALNEP